MSPALASPASGPVLCSDLIRHELQAKNAAIASYVEILWRIRSGFVVVIGAVLAFGTKEGGAEASLLRLGTDKYAAVVVVAALACALDLLYFWRELNVIRAYHTLIDYALENAPDCVGSHADPVGAGSPTRHDVVKAFASEHVGAATVKDLLRISGEGCSGRYQWLQRIIPYLLYIVPLVLSVLALSVQSSTAGG